MIDTVRVDAAAIRVLREPRDEPNAAAPNVSSNQQTNELAGLLGNLVGAVATSSSVMIDRNSGAIRTGGMGCSRTTAPDSASRGPVGGLNHEGSAAAIAAEQCGGWSAAARDASGQTAACSAKKARCTLSRTSAPEAGLPTTRAPRRGAQFGGSAIRVP
jgi:hypothetical protein